MSGFAEGAEELRARPAAIVRKLKRNLWAA
jgi:hypothetical protein